LQVQNFHLFLTSGWVAFSFYVYFSFSILVVAIHLDGKVPNLEEMALLQNVGAVHESLFTRLVNSLFFHWFLFTTTTSEFTQNPMKSFCVQGHLLL